MQMTLRALSALAILGSVAFVLAQQIAAKTEGGQGNGPQSANARGRATSETATINGKLYRSMPNQHPGPWKYAPPTGAQAVLRRFITGETNRLIELSKSEGRQDRVEKIIEAQCFYLLTVMRPDQQKHEMYDVWNVDVWKPGGQWDHVTSAPSLVRALGSMPADQSKRVEAAFARREDEWMRPFMDLSAKASKQAGNDVQKYRALYNEAFQKQFGHMSKLAMANGHTAKLRQGMSESYALLTPSQKQEWDMILRNFTVDAQAAYRGEPVKLGPSTK